MIKTDVTNRADIERIVYAFYEKAKLDSRLGKFFSGEIPIDWEKHLPVMCSFWENALFYSGGYSGDMMGIHRKVHEQLPMVAEDFGQWTQLFCETVAENFEGEIAERAKQRALGMATMLQIKIPVG